MSVAEVDTAPVVSEYRMHIRETDWRPDVHMPIPFSTNNLLMAGLYVRGADLTTIAEILEYSPLYARRLFHDVRFIQSIPHKIVLAEGFLPESTAQAALWMYKHKFLPPIPQSEEPQHGKLFSETQIHVMETFMAGYTRQKTLAKNAHVSANTLRNYLGRGRGSIRENIASVTGISRMPTHQLAAGFWMVEQGYISAQVIGEALP